MTNISPAFKHGSGDGGVTGLQRGVVDSKSSPVAKAFNAMEEWVLSLVRANEHLLFFIHLDHTTLAQQIFDYLQDNAYVLGAVIYNGNENTYRFDPALLTTLDEECKHLDVGHNFITPSINHATLDELRINTRKLESRLVEIFPETYEVEVTLSIINRFSTYVYYLENELRSHSEVQTNDWSMVKRPVWKSN